MRELPARAGIREIEEEMKATGVTVRRLAAAGAAAVVAAATALSGIAAGVAGAQTTAGWHILVYTVNDSSTDLPLGLDIDEMVNASRAGVDFTVYVDASAASDPAFESGSVPHTDEAVIVEIADGTATIAQRLGELDSGSPDTLGWFISQSLQAHPAEQVGLVVWDHGLGWQGIAFDEDVTASGTSRRVSYLDAAELGAAVDRGVTDAGREQLDLLVLDACLMANFEIVSESFGNAPYLISSEELVPGIGLDYDSFDVFAEPAADINTIFDRIAAGFVADVESLTPNQSDMITLSLIDLNQAPAIDTALGAFTQAASVDVVTNAQPYLQAANEGFKYGYAGDYWPGFLDLGEYLNRLKGVSDDVLTARNTLLAAIDGAVIDQIGSASYGSATGLTVYFPTEPREYDSNYDSQPTAQLWRPFLSSFYDAQAQVVLDSDIGFVSETLDIVPVENGGYQISAPVTANFTGTIELLAALPDANGQLNYFETDSGAPANGQATAVLYPTLTTISDGTTSAVPFTQYVLEDDGWHGYSEFTLQRSDGSIVNLNWDRAAEGSTGPFTIIDPSGTVIGYTPVAGDLAYPIVMVQTPSGQPERQATAPALDVNQQWTVFDDPIAQGTQVFVEMQLKDAAGTVVDAVSTYFTVGQE